jgi:hypothetical protein
MYNMLMRKTLFALGVVGIFFTVAQTQVLAVKSPRIASTSALVSSTPPTASASANATDSAAIATPSAQPAVTVPDKKDQDITEVSSQQKDKLVAYLDENPPGPLSWYNFLGHAIRSAVKQGVPANTIVLMLLFPLIASIIAASRHIIGLRGFGIYIPAVLSVALVSTGLIAGTIVFLAIVSVAVLSKKILKQLRLSYLPRTAMLLWMISISILAVMLISPILNLGKLTSINIFPILILILLSENFLDAQASTKPSDAIALAAETIGLAFVSGLILRWAVFQKIALLQPELLIILTACFNVVVGKFVGLRVTEWLRFRPIIEE